MNNHIVCCVAQLATRCTCLCVLWGPSLMGMPEYTTDEVVKGSRQEGSSGPVSATPLPQEARDRCFQKEKVHLMGESACRSDTLECGPFWNIARKWALRARIVPRWGLVAWIWLKMCSLGVARPDEARCDTPWPSRPRDSDFSGISGILPERNVSKTTQVRKPRTFPIPRRRVWPRFASLLSENFSSLIAARGRKLLAPRRGPPRPRVVAVPTSSCACLTKCLSVSLGDLRWGAGSGEVLLTVDQRGRTKRAPGTGATGTI